MTALIEDRYPQLAAWIREQGWIELGSDGFSASFIRVLDEGGMAWEGEEQYPSIDAALAAAEAGLIAWMRQQGIHLSSASGNALAQD